MTFTMRDSLIRHEDPAKIAENFLGSARKRYQKLLCEEQQGVESHHRKGLLLQG
jgi:hypothetical protein